MSKPTKSTIKRTLHYFWRELMRHKSLTFLAALLTILATIAFSILTPFLMATIIDHLSDGNIPDLELIPQVLPYGIAIIVSTVLNGLVIQRIRIWALWKMELKAVYNLHCSTFTTLTDHSMKFHDNRFSGSLVSQTNKFASAFERIVDVTIFDMLPMFFTFTLSFIVLSFTAPFFVLPLIGLVIIYMIIAFIAFRIIDPYNSAAAEAENKQSGQLADSLSNILTVKSYGRESHERRRFANVSRASFDANYRLLRVSTIRDFLFGIIITAISVLIVIFLIYGRLWFGISIGTLILITTYSLQICSQLWIINHILRQFNRSLGDAHEMTLILDSAQSVTDKPKAPVLKVKKGHVKINQITFTHSENKDAIFHDFSLDIQPGERIGLVGRSGSGKTTLTKLLLRFADVQNGEITIDNQNISAVTQVSLRESIAYVPQEATLFHRTLRENIAYAKPDATEKQVIHAAKLANAWEFIETLPKGLDTLTGERGVKLSGGQRQRIAIARAILKDAPILVLDEATSALDSESEKLIQDALTRLMKNRTSIVIAHRLSTVASLDRIIVLKDGQISESGPHADLVESNGEYAKLWHRQAGAMLDFDN
ncbi:ABC transporter ATP-binding protein/permease [Candidatus Saccharibacteria bacterium]|nr:ABC transporter ATP-binding protein/permease [Candidatus Saccharibacteria bacterium]